VSGLAEGLYQIPLGLTQRAFELTGSKQADYLMQREKERRIEAERSSATERPSVAESFGKFSGETLPWMAAGAAAGPSIPAAIGLGGLQGLARPTASKAETLASPLIGATLAGATTAATRFALPRNVSEPEHMAAVRAAQRENVPLTGGQITDEPIVRRAEAQAVWNPLTKFHAIPFQRKQDDQFIRGLLKQAGVPESNIAKNPTLDPQTLSSVRKEIGNRFDKVFVGQVSDLDAQNNPDLWRAIIDARRVQLPKEPKSAVNDMVQQVTQLASQGRVSGPVLKDYMEMVSEEAKRLTEAGHKRAGDALNRLHDALVNSTSDPAAYKAVKADYARLMTIEDSLRRSSGMVEGVPDRALLAKAVERNMPGGILYDKSSMADLARAGNKARPLTALPDRATGWMQPSDVPNAGTYWRFNNPLAKWGLLNPNSRDELEGVLRYLPGAYTLDQTEKVK
jgi:hypothetical protein